jgi:hypothetical protein
MTISKEMLDALRGGIEDETRWDTVVINKDTLSKLIAAAEEAEILRAQLAEAQASLAFLRGPFEAVIAKVRNEAFEEAKQACLSRISDDGKCFDVQEKMDCEDHEALNCSNAIEALKTEVKE